MTDLTRHCCMQESDRYLPAVMTQGNASTYQTMIDSSSPQMGMQQQTEAPQPDGAGQSGYNRITNTQNSGYGTPQGRQNFSSGLGPLPSGNPGMSAAEQILHSSWKNMMARNVGRSVIVSFLIGTQNTIVTHGILYEVGSDYIALYQPDEKSFISADLYSIRFMEFLPEVSDPGPEP